jgi:hypothetical protein
MAAFKHGKILEVVHESPSLVEVRVAVESGEMTASGFPQMLGPVRTGDRVVLNTTGIDLGLGTGGHGFVLWNLDGPGPPGPGPGHIVKLRYTPWQTEVLASEEPGSPHHHALEEASDIGGMPVVACGLHSQIAGVAAGIKAALPGARVGYLMTDGAALPIAWSKLVARLREQRLIDATCTCGHAFGGEYEAINVYSGLATLRLVAGADVAVVAMGPGVVGTGTALGFTAIEQGQVLDAAGALGGFSIACLRICWADERPRHRGLSHHTLTALTLAARERATVVVPELPEHQLRPVIERLTEAGVPGRHDVVRGDGRPGLALLEDHGLEVPSMGRPMRDFPELHLAAAAAGGTAAARL